MQQSLLTTCNAQALCFFLRKPGYARDSRASQASLAHKSLSTAAQGGIHPPTPLASSSFTCHQLHQLYQTRYRGRTPTAGCCRTAAAGCPDGNTLPRWSPSITHPGDPASQQGHPASISCWGGEGLREAHAGGARGCSTPGVPALGSAALAFRGCKALKLDLQVIKQRSAAIVSALPK